MLFTTLLALLAAAPGLGLAAAVPVAVRGDTSSVTVRQVKIPAPTQEELEVMTDRLEFDTWSNKFEQIREDRNPEYAMLDWTSNGCAPAPDHPYWWNFRGACVRRDFAVRNFQKQNRLPANLARINDQYEKDLMRECEHHHFSKWLCQLKARRVYLEPVLHGREPGSLYVQMSIAEVNATSLEAPTVGTNGMPLHASIEDALSEGSETEAATTNDSSM